MISKSENQTKQFAKIVLEKLGDKNIIALFGDLGSGKTVFAKGIAKELKIKENITSPTFILIKEYLIKINSKKQDTNSKQYSIFNIQYSKLIHVDLYRLNKIDQIFLDQLFEYINDRSNLIIIEWADRLGKNLPKKCFQIKFKHIDENKREIIIN